MAKRSVLRKIAKERAWNSRSRKSLKAQKQRLEQLNTLLSKNKKTPVTLTLLRGFSGRTQEQRDTLLRLGLKKIRSTSQRNLTPVVRGMVDKVRHLIALEEKHDKIAST